MSWEQRWKDGQVPWDKGASPPILRELVEEGSLPAGRAFVPGCGSGHDVFSLAGPTRRVIGLDVSPTAARRFDEARAALGIDPRQAEIVVADFFAYEPDAPFDLIWDYTFLCALPPSLRGDWARKVESLLAPGGELITLIYPDVDKPLDQGPPFALHPSDVRDLLEPRFEATTLQPVLRSHPDRRGKEHLARWQRNAAP